MENDTILRQSQLDSFSILYPDCTELESISLFTSNIKDLSALGNLKYIKSLIINRTAINNLTGLDNLQRAEYIMIRGNDDLKDFSALKKLKYLGTLTMTGNNSLKSLEGIEVDTVMWLVITGSKLKNLKGLGAKYCRNFDLYDSYLDDLSGHNLQYIQHAQLSGVGNIDSIHTLNPEKLLIEVSPRLHDITPLNSLTNLKWLNIAGNSNLSWCSVDIICRNLDNPDFSLEVNWNAKGCRNKVEIREGCISGTESHIIEEHIRFSPQPVMDVLNISGLSENTPYMIINMVGDRVMSGITYESIDMSSLPAGMYVLQLFDKTKQKVLKRVKVVKM
ncbi:MAG: T9SS type A sorting domain-containing protein [Chitinophagales bacterium]|nr:T9SS type A sorting domain-containing protein [Chitinophagales bacterium]